MIIIYFEKVNANSMSLSQEDRVNLMKVNKNIITIILILLEIQFKILNYFFYKHNFSHKNSNNALKK